MSKALLVVALAAAGAGVALLASKKSDAATPDNSLEATGASGTQYHVADVTQADSPPGQVFFDVYDAQGPVMQYTQLTTDERRIMTQAYVQGPRLETAAQDFQVRLV
jgi:hypothetical protein